MSRARETSRVDPETVATVATETKARAIAIAHAETSRSETRRDVLEQPLRVYRDRLDGIQPPPPSWPEQCQQPDRSG